MRSSAFVAIAALVVVPVSLLACKHAEKKDSTESSSGADEKPSASAYAANPKPKPQLKRTPHTLALGGLHSCAIADDGSLRCWGENSFGQLGIGTAGPGNTKPTPQSAQGLADVVDVAAGAAHTCAIAKDGSVKCWGKNDFGQATDSKAKYDEQSVNVPTLPVGLDGTVIAAAPGNAHTCVALKGGKVDCWGLGISGELGVADSMEQLGGSGKVTEVVGIEDVVDLAASGGRMWGHTCALKKNGDVICWGRNTYGELGQGTITDKKDDKADGGLAPPTSPVLGVKNAIAVAAGPDEACALIKDGTVMCWGSVAELVGADPKKEPKIATPRAVPGVSGAKKLAIGYGFGCVTNDAGTLQCWGINGAGQLGRPVSKTVMPLDEVPGLGAIDEVAIGDDHVCVRKKDKTVWCWGSNESGQLGTGDTRARAEAKQVKL